MGKITFQLAPKYLAAIRGIIGPDREPMAFTNCARDRLRAYFPGSETSRMRGLPETCRMAAPPPTSRMVSRKRAKEVSPKLALRRPRSATSRPSMSTNFLPCLSWKTPMGMDSRPNMQRPTKGMRDAMALLSWNSFLARLTKGPTASAKPMAMKARKTGMVRSRISDRVLREYGVYRLVRDCMQNRAYFLI